MGFQLVIAEGKEAGREFVFDQTEVLIGRTSECDVILYDPGVSRKHARIFSEGEVFFVEDVGSSNGTKVNGALITKHQLKDGDAIALGPVVFGFTAVALDDAPTEAIELGAEAGQHTRVVSASELKRSRNKGVAALPANVGREELADLGRRTTGVIQAIKPPRASGAGLTFDPEVLKPRQSAPRTLAADAEQPKVRPSRGLARLHGLDQQEEGLKKADDTEPVMARPARKSNSAAPALAASDRARIRRESGAGPIANFRIWWAEASQQRRTMVTVGVSVLGAVVVGTFAWFIIPHGEVKKAKEPTELTGDPIEASFGLGEGVTFERPDQKTFNFDVKTPVQALVVLHYQCKDISQNEVLVSVNGQEIGFLPPDTLAANEHSYEMIVPATVVNRNAGNIVTFDNVKNPPENDTWRIWNVWAEIAVLPETNAESLVKAAKDNLIKGDQKWDQRDIGAPNRWDAYKSYREAWLMLEAVPDTITDRATTSNLARSKMAEVKKELDLTCNKLLLEARSLFNQKQYDQARRTLDHVTEYFPSKSHPCQFRAEQERTDFEL